MATANPSIGTELRANPHAQSSPNHTKIVPKSTQSAPGSSRRHSLPLHFLPPSLWSANTSSASLVESEEAARGEHILDEATIAHRLTALRSLNGANKSRHRYAKSTGARNSTYNQPVIVRTYSGAARPRSQQKDTIAAKKQNGMSGIATAKMDLKLPPVEAFSFKGIMDEIRSGVDQDIQRIAEICARSKYSLSNQYEVHMPPHGRGESIVQTAHGATGSGASGAGPTLQAVGSDDEQTRHSGRGSRNGRRAKSAAYGTLETIMSSSRSSDEDKSKKKPAAVLAEEVRGRAAKKVVVVKQEVVEDAVETEPAPQRPSKHVRSKSATFASMIIDNAQGSKHDSGPQIMSPISLISEPARPQTSTATGIENIPTFDESTPIISPTLQDMISPKHTLIRNESMASTLRAEPEQRHSILGSLGSWFSWRRSGDQKFGRARTSSHAEGSLRNLLNTPEANRKGKGVDRIL